MSSQRANSAAIASRITGSACSMPPRVSSENTTPKPNVSSWALRSQTSTSQPGSSCLARAAKYSPPGPPPITAILMTASSRHDGDAGQLDQRRGVEQALDFEERHRGVVLAQMAPVERAELLQVLAVLLGVGGEH